MNALIRGACALFFGATSASACANAETYTREALGRYPVTVLHLLLNGRVYDGAEVIIRGYLGHDVFLSLPALYFVSEHINVNDSNLGIPLYDKDLKLYQGEHCEHLGSYVSIVGIYKYDTGMVIVQSAEAFNEADNPIRADNCLALAGRIME